MSNSIKTKFGNAVKNKRGYYQITSHKEGNHGKLLHRLIYEDYYGVTLLPGTVIHHKDKNTSNNCILNLEAMSTIDHNQTHHLGAKRSKETCKRISDANKNNNKQSNEIKLKISKSNNTSGYFRVSKYKNKAIKQGYTWAYRYYEDGDRKLITCIHLDKLKEKVLAKGLPWIEF